MRYKLIQRINPNDIRSDRKWYAIPVNSGKTVTLDDLAKQVSGRSSLTRGDVNSALQNLVDELPMFLLMGQSVQLGELGTVRISFSSSGIDDPAKFHTSMIRPVKIIFTPGWMMKKELDEITFWIDK